MYLLIHSFLLSHLKRVFLHNLMTFILLLQNILKMIFCHNILRLIFLLIKFSFVYLIFWFLNVVLDLINYLLWELWVKVFMLRLFIYKLNLWFKLKTVSVFNSTFSCWILFIFINVIMNFLLIYFYIFKFSRVCRNSFA